MEPKGWYSRGYLPHFDGGEIPQAITFRLADSLPKERLDAWERELHDLPNEEAKTEYRRRVEAYLDAGHGEAWLADPRIADIIENALLHFDGERYYLHGWVIMPNHVHALITPRRAHRLLDIVRSWKSYTANKANRILGRNGTLWQAGYFDRFIRNDHHFAAALAYIEDNPVKAGLCSKPEEWRYSSASR
ncbi:transposase [Candidatus Poribacteria bacterium]